nr:RNA-directed DNA polymerase, eukaryota [Tanacetum cinerariifolium]
MHTWIKLLLMRIKLLLMWIQICLSGLNSADMALARSNRKEGDSFKQPRSKEDDVQKISTSVFVTNFPDGYGAKDLWTTCKLYGHVVDVFIPDRRTKAGNQVQNVGMKECPNMVLDETCLNHEDFSLCLLGKVKEFASLTNLKVVRAIEVPGWVPNFEEDAEEGNDMNDRSYEDDMYGGVSENLKDVEGESDREEVHGTNFKELPDKSIFEGNSVRQNDVHSEDPFGIYEEDGVCVGQHVHERVEVSNDTHESICSGHFKKSKVPRKGGSILELIDDLVSVGQTMGYDMLWDYLSFVIGNWDSEVVIMRDFNEVHDISERFGFIFNKHGVKAFNSFIVNAGLVEVPLGGGSFTWCHKSAKKMSKLDRFLIFDNHMCSYPSISSTSLDRFLSHHRPIIMREAHYDYGPILFKFFHNWFELDGFDKLVEQTWLEANVETNS